MKQSRLESILETTLNIASGFFISWGVWVWVIGPSVTLGWLTMKDGFIITCVFTVTSFIRSLVWRRLFNAGVHRRVHAFVLALKRRGVIDD